VLSAIALSSTAAVAASTSPLAASPCVWELRHRGERAGAEL